MIQKSQLPLILVTAFLDLLGMSLFIPLLPGIITAFGMHASWTGYSQAIYAIGMFLGGITFGKLSDRYGRKHLLSYTSLINLLGYIFLLISVWNISIDTSSTSVIASEGGAIGISHLAEAFQGLTPAFLFFLFARCIGGLGGSGYGVISAYIADISAPTERVKNMGYMGAVFGVAFLVGPAFAGILSEFFSIHTILIVSSVIIFANVILIRIFLEEPRRHQHVENVDLGDFHFSRVVLSLFLISFGAMLGFSAMQSMSSQLFMDRFMFSASQIGYTMAFIGLISVLYQGWLVKYIRKNFTEVQMLHGAFLLLTTGFIGFAMNMSSAWLYFWVMFFPIGMGSFQPSISALLVHRAGKNQVGEVMGYNTSIQSIGQIIGPIMAGMLYIAPGSGLPFLVAGGIFFLLFLFSFTIPEKKGDSGPLPVIPNE